MSMNTNLAYDLERFEEHEAPAEAAKPTIIRHHERTVHPAKIVLAAVLALALGFSILYSQVLLTELNGSINSAERRLDVLQAESVRMQTELEGKMSLKEIENIAISEYGMVKPDGAQVTYVQLEQESRMETAKTEESFIQKVVRYVGNLLE